MQSIKTKILTLRCSSRIRLSATTLLTILKCPNYSLINTMLLSCKAQSRKQVKIKRRNHCLSYPRINLPHNCLRSLTSTIRVKYKTKRFTTCLRSISTQKRIVLQSGKRSQTDQVAIKVTAYQNIKVQENRILMWSKKGAIP